MQAPPSCGGRSTDARSRRDLVDLFLERIERLDPRLERVPGVLADQARPRPTGRRRASTPARTPLLGVPVAIKDEFDVAGQLNTCCAPPDQVAATDSEVVRRLRAAGAVPLGITNVPELTIWPFTETESWGKTANPWDANRTPGGSSGGSAAAVAAGSQPSPSARTVPDRSASQPRGAASSASSRSAAGSPTGRCPSTGTACRCRALRAHGPRRSAVPRRDGRARAGGCRRSRPAPRSRSRRPRGVSPARWIAISTKVPAGDRARLAGRADRRRLDRRPAALARPRRPRARPRLRLCLEPRHAPLPAWHPRRRPALPHPSGSKAPRVRSRGWRCSSRKRGETQPCDRVENRGARQLAVPRLRRAAHAHDRASRTTGREMGGARRADDAQRGDLALPVHARCGTSPASRPHPSPPGSTAPGMPMAVS